MECIWCTGGEYSSHPSPVRLLFSSLAVLASTPLLLFPVIAPHTLPILAVNPLTAPARVSPHPLAASCRVCSPPVASASIAASPRPRACSCPTTTTRFPTPLRRRPCLSSIVHHGRWLAQIDALHEFDRTADDTKINRREATRFVSASQFGAGMWLEAAPDASLPNSRLKSAPSQ